MHVVFEKTGENMLCTSIYEKDSLRAKSAVQKQRKKKRIN